MDSMKAWPTARGGEAVDALSCSVAADDSALRSGVRWWPAAVRLVDRVVADGPAQGHLNGAPAPRRLLVWRRVPSIEEQYLAQAVDAQDLQVRLLALERARARDCLHRAEQVAEGAADLQRPLQPAHAQAIVPVLVARRADDGVRIDHHAAMHLDEVG